MSQNIVEKLSSFFEWSCLTYPGNAAVTFVPRDGQSRHTTYQELSARSSKVEELLKTLCKTKEPVALHSRQLTGLIACLLGVLKAGCCFVPIDLNWAPVMVCQFLLKLNVRYVLVQEQLLESFENVLSYWRKLLTTESRTELIQDEAIRSNGYLLVHLIWPSVNSEIKVTSLDLAYVMQTSGTTGEPKPVKVPHSCIVPNVIDFRRIFQVTSHDVVFVASPYTFDPFVVQLFVAFAAGARAVLVPDEIKRVPAKLCHHLFDREGVTIIQPTPSLMNYIGPELIRSKLLCVESSLRVLAFGGESCPSLSTLRQWRPRDSKTQIYNLYGITEVSCWASCYHITDNELHDKKILMDTKEVSDIFGSFSSLNLENEMPLGDALMDTVIEVHGEDDGIIDEGIGQIYIGGSNRVCFLGDETSLIPGKMRATGDWAYIKNRKMWYCGRRDRQIKRMGKRLNLDWIQREISEQVLDNSACSLVCEEVAGKNRGRLHLFVVNNPTCTDDKETKFLERRLRELLPSYAQPDYIHVISHLPMTAHGKVNRKALLTSLNDKASSEESESVRHFIAGVWSKVLEVRENTEEKKQSSSETKRVSRGSHETLHLSSVSDESLFVVSGGTSLGAVKLVDTIETWMKKKTNTSVSLPELLDIVLNKPFGLLCCYVENKLEQSLIVTGVLKNDKTVNQLKKEIGDEFGSRELFQVKMNDSETSILMPTTNEQVKPQLKNDRIQVRPIQTRESLVRKSLNVQNSHLWQLTDHSSKRKSLPSQNDELGSLRVELKKPKLPHGCLSKTEENFSGKEDLPREHKTELGSCFCSVRRGMQRSLCKVCRQQRSHTTFPSQFPVDPCEPLMPLPEVSPSHSPEESTDRIFDNDRESCDLNLPQTVTDSTSYVFMCHKWCTCLYKCIDASPLVVYSPLRTDGEVFIGSHGHVFMCIRLSDGSILWESRVGDRIESSAALSDSGRNVIVGCYDGKVYVFNRATGDTEWTFETGAPVKSSPCVDPVTRLAWVGSHDHYLYAFDVTRQECACALHCGGGSCFSSPSISNDPHLVFTATLTGRLLAVHPTEHTILWSQQCPKPVFASPLVIPSGVVCACVDGFLYCFDFRGNSLWYFQSGDSIFSSPCYKDVRSNCEAVSGHIVFGSHDSFVYCLSSNGKLQWSFSADGPIYSSPFIAQLTSCHSTGYQATLYNQHHTSGIPLAVFVFSTVGTLFVLELFSGRLLASYSFPGEVFSSPVVVNNHLLVGCRNDFLYMLAVVLKD